MLNNLLQLDRLLNSKLKPKSDNKFLSKLHLLDKFYNNRPKFKLVPQFKLKLSTKLQCKHNRLSDKLPQCKLNRLSDKLLQFNNNKWLDKLLQFNNNKWLDKLLLLFNNSQFTRLPLSSNLLQFTKLQSIRLHHKYMRQKFTKSQCNTSRTTRPQLSKSMYNLLQFTKLHQFNTLLLNQLQFNMLLQCKQLQSTTLHSQSQLTMKRRKPTRNTSHIMLSQLSNMRRSITRRTSNQLRLISMTRLTLMREPLSELDLRTSMSHQSLNTLTSQKQAPTLL